MRPLIDIHGALDGVALSLRGEVLMVGTWTACSRAQIAACQALDELDRICRTESLQNQRRSL